MQKPVQWERLKNVTVKTSEWKSSCKSILVPAEESRPPNTRLVGARLSRSIQKFSSKKRQEKKLKWHSATEFNKLKENRKERIPPKRLTLAEKVELFDDRPDLDLMGLMPRLAALRHLENMGRPYINASSGFDFEEKDNDIEMMMEADPETNEKNQDKKVLPTPAKTLLTMRRQIETRLE